MKKVILTFMFGGLVCSTYSQTLVATDALGVPRTKHQAVVMDNGNVLCFGGNDGYSSPVYYASAEIYNIGTQTWSNTGSMSQGRDNFASALLSNGKVIAIGGKFESTYSMVSCELYDPGTGTWTAGPDLNNGRWGHSAVTLQNGKVLVAGGDDDYGTSAEIYDPVANTWTLTTDMQYEHGQYSSLVLLADGKVLCTGGWWASPDGTIAEVYDPLLNTWTAVGNMNQDRSLKHGSVLMSDGKVLIIGGTLSGSADIFDPLTGNFTATTSTAAAKVHCQVFRLSDGKVFAFSKGNISAPTSCMEIYNPLTTAWDAPYSTFYGMSAGAGVVLNNGTIMLIAGNVTTGSGALTSCYLVNGITAGIEEGTIVSNLDLSIYPNPANNQITIEIKSSTGVNLEKIEILDCSGRLIATHSSEPGNKFELDISEYESGIYYSKAISDNGTIAVQQFIVE